MIKTIIFDNNGVLVTSNNETGYPALEKIIGPEIKKFIPVYEKLAEKVDEGKITTQRFFELAIKEARLDLSPHELKKIQYGSFIRKEEVIKLVQELSKKYEIAVLSNFGDSYWDLNKNWRIDSFVPKEKIFVSCELKMRKPQKKIYLEVLEQLNRKPEEAIFIDDEPEFVKAAEAVGIRSILFTSPNELGKQLKYILEGNPSTKVQDK